MKLQCKLCGIRGTADLAFIWYGKEIGGKTVWLCPDCGDTFGSDKERDRALTQNAPKPTRGGNAG